MPKVGDQRTLTIAAGTILENAMQGRRFERAPYLAKGWLYCTGSAAGILAELNIGGRSVSPPINVNAQNRLPVVPDDLLFGDWLIAPGELLQITVQNPTANPLDFNFKIELEEQEVVEV